MYLAKGVEASVEDMSLARYYYMNRATGGIGWQAKSGFHLIIFALEMGPGEKAGCSQASSKGCPLCQGLHVLVVQAHRALMV